MKPAALDIETVAVPEAVERALSDPPEFSAPSNYKDPEKIEAHVAKQADEWEEKIRTEAPLSELTGKVVAVAIVNDEREREGSVFPDFTEAALLDFVADELAGNCNRIVTFNGTAFDIRFLRNRMLMHGVTPPKALQPESRYAMQRQVDLRDYLTGFDRYMSGKLADWCRAFGVEEPEEHTPEDVAAAYEDGDWEKLRRIARSDAEATWELYQRVEPALPALPALRGR